MALWDHPITKPWPAGELVNLELRTGFTAISQNSPQAAPREKTPAAPLAREAQNLSAPKSLPDKTKALAKAASSNKDTTAASPHHHPSHPEPNKLQPHTSPDMAPGVVTPAHSLEGLMPQYPYGSIRRREQGRVTCEVVAKAGKTTARIAQSSGYSRLDQAALNAIKSYSFRELPGGRMVVAFDFQLNSQRQQ